MLIGIAHSLFLVYSKSEKSDLDPGKVLQKEFDRDWELDEYKDYKNDCLDILGVMDSRKAKRWRDRIDKE